MRYSSLELSGDYDRAKAAHDRDTESATLSYTKRRGIAGEIKQFKEQKAEAERFEKKCRERVIPVTAKTFLMALTCIPGRDGHLPFSLGTFPYGEYHQDNYAINKRQV